MSATQVNTVKKKKIGLVKIDLNTTGSRKELATAAKKTPVILLNSVRKLGKAGQLVRVAGGFGRYLITEKKAVYATADNMDKLDEYKSRLSTQDAEKVKEAEAVKAKLDGLEFTFFCKVRDRDNIYGSIQTHDISEKLKEAKFDIEKSQILLGQSLKVLGSYGVSISLYGDVEAHVILHLKSSAEEEMQSAAAFKAAQAAASTKKSAEAESAETA